MIPHAGTINECLHLSGNLLEIDRGCQNNSVRLLKLLHNGCGIIREYTASPQNTLFTTQTRLDIRLVKLNDTQLDLMTFQDGLYFHQQPIGILFSLAAQQSHYLFHVITCV